MPHSNFGYLSVLAFVLLLPLLVTPLNSDGLTLLALKSAVTADPTRSLRSWLDTDSTPCDWLGVACDARRRVAGLSLSNLRLTGYIPSELSLLSSLRSLSLSFNNFSNPIPSRLFNLTELRSLDLSHNSLSGRISEDISNLKSLIHLDLSANLLNGSLPETLPELPLSGVMNLSHNRFTGEIPTSFGRFPVSVSLDLQHNNLTGKIPQGGSLLNQGPTAFAGNPSLCGFPTRTPCPDIENPRIPINPQTPIPSKPEPKPSYAVVGESKSASPSFVTVPIISGVSFVVGAVSVSVWVFRRKWSAHEGKVRKESRVGKSADDVGEEGKFVVMDEGFGLELEDLLRASAYVVGKSRSGIVYKVVAGRGIGGAGVVVAVRRLSEGGSFLRLKEFESEMETIASVDHPNIVRLRAYYYASDEKLVVSDFIANGSLYSALHGGPSNCLPALSWAARLNIAQGTARGLMYIHECSPRKYVHGSIKSSKILLDDDLQPYISGFGLTRLFANTNKSADPASRKPNSTQPVVSLGIGSKTSACPPTSYSAPEARTSGSRLTQKCDVYSFGIVVLELLTGRLPQAEPEKDYKELECYVRRAFREARPLSEVIDPALMHEVYAKKQVLEVFHIALNCTEIVPEMRPRMKTVSESLESVGSH